MVTTFIYANESRVEHAVLIFSTMTKMTHQVDHVLAVLVMMSFSISIFHSLIKKKKNTGKEE